MPDQAVSPAGSPPAVQVLAGLLRAHGAATRALNAKLQSEHGLSLNGYEALYLLSQAEGRRLRRVDLARSLALTPSGVTRLLEGLEASGLVERTLCSSDLRVAYAQLTDAGAEKLQVASCGHEGSVRELFEQDFTCDELNQLAELLGRLSRAA